MKARRVLVPLAVAAMLALVFGAPAMGAANGGDRPIQGHAAGSTYWTGANPLGCWAGETTFATLWGTSSHLGAVRVETMHCPYEMQPVGVIDLIAANGDMLHGTYVLTFTSTLPEDLVGPIPGVMDVTLDPATSTGRFEGAMGSTTLSVYVEGQGLEDADWPAWFAWEGTIGY